MYVWITKPGASRIRVPAASVARWEALGWRRNFPRPEVSQEPVEQQQQQQPTGSVDDTDQDMSTSVDTDQDDTDQDSEPENQPTD